MNENCGDSQGLHSIVIGPDNSMMKDCSNDLSPSTTAQVSEEYSADRKILSDSSICTQPHSSVTRRTLGMILSFECDSRSETVRYVR
jgi:hypothetical protein